MCNGWTSSRSLPVESLCGSSLTISFSCKCLHEILCHANMLRLLVEDKEYIFNRSSISKELVFSNLQRYYLTQSLERRIRKLFKDSHGSWRKIYKERYSLSLPQLAHCFIHSQFILFYLSHHDYDSAIGSPDGIRLLLAPFFIQRWERQVSVRYRYQVALR